MSLAVLLFASLLCALQVHGAQFGAPKSPGHLLIKLAVFVDEPLAQQLVGELIQPDKLETFLGAYVGQMEAALAGLRSERIPGGLKLKLVEVDKFNASSGDLDELLSEFCLHQMESRQQNWDSKWDLGLLLTSRDLFSGNEGTGQSASTLGISPVAGIDWPDLSCLVVELGVGRQLEALKDSHEQRVYPTRGLASAYVAAHELAHSLGIQHDDDACDPERVHVMSPNQSPHLDEMRLEWSSCSSDSLNRLAPGLLARFKSSEESSQNKLPGQLFDAQFQCRMFSGQLDFVADKVNKEAICNKSLLCTSGDNRLVAIGPALEGTGCGLAGDEERICRRHTCAAPSSPSSTASDADL